MIGKILTVALVVIGIVMAISIYYLQVYYYYDSTDADRSGLALARADRDEPMILPVENYDAIDANSSPIRYRACFGYDADLPRGDLVPMPGALPLNAPGWFDCFDANAIGAALQNGSATAFLSEKNIGYGADRIVALTDDGRGYVWHQLNNCGEKAYDGTQVGEDCPPREDFE